MIPTNKKYIKSPLNYTGGKYKLLPQIFGLFPKEPIDKFVDLFAGGLNVGINVETETIYVNDNMRPLIKIYELFKTSNTDAILKQINDRIKYFNLSKTNLCGYMDLRQTYNTTKDPLDLFVLICYSFNNQIRFNNSGEYNMPFGKNRSSFNERMKQNLINFCEALHTKNIKFSCENFIEFNTFIGFTDKSLVYCDPPLFNFYCDI